MLAVVVVSTLVAMHRRILTASGVGRNSAGAPAPLAETAARTETANVMDDQ